MSEPVIIFYFRVDTKDGKRWVAPVYGNELQKKYPKKIKLEFVRKLNKQKGLMLRGKWYSLSDIEEYAFEDEDLLAK